MHLLFRLLILLLLLSSQARALTFQAIVLSDEIDSNPGDGVCEIPFGMGFCSIRAAVMEANALGGSHTIVLSGSEYTLTRLGEDDTALLGDLDITNADIEIIGVGAATVINANGNNRIFEVFNGRTFSLAHLTLTAGRAATASNNTGGAIQVNNTGTQIITEQVTITNNSANSGGGISAFGGTELYLNNTNIVNNFTEDLGFTNIFGPAVFCSDCELRISHSTVSGNNMGGKAIELSGGSLFMTNTTITANEGGGIRTSNANAVIRFSTLVSDSGQNVSHFSFDDSQDMDIGNSILQTTPGAFIDNCQAGDKPISSGYNIVSDSSCEFSAIGDQEMSDAMLAAISNNGGPTETFVPDPSSSAVDLVPISACLSADNDVLLTDQRGSPRPDGGFCDAGAVELSLDVIFVDGFEAKIPF